MKRLFYLVDDITNAEDISEDLHQHGISDWRFHVISKDEAGLYSHHLHSASIIDRTDLPRYVERGLIIGAVLALSFLLPLWFFGAFDLPGGAWVALGIFTVVAGGWIGGFGGINAENYRIRRFHKDIEAGRYLIMVDVPKSDREKMKELMAKKHPEAELQGESSSFNNPFAAEDDRVHVFR